MIPRTWFGLATLAGCLCTGASECGSIDTSTIDDAEFRYRKIGDLSGVVMNSETLALVQGAMVRVADKFDETDSTGAFAVLGLHAGTQILTIRADSFEPFNTEVEVKPGSNSAGVLAIVPIAPQKLCGNGVKDTGEACDWQGNIGCNDPTPFCQTDCDGCAEKPVTLLWDGSFHGNEHRDSKYVFHSDGQYKESTCLAQADSFAVVLASSLPAGRKGYAGKFYDGVGAAYECNSNRRVQILGKVPDHPGPTGIRDVWYGWSQYLEPPWSPSGGTMGTGSIGIALIENGATVSGKGIGLVNYPDSWVFQVNAAGVEHVNILEEDMSGKWYDWMYHIKWARDNTGFLEIYVKRPGDTDYGMIYSKYDFVSEYPQPGIDPEDSIMEVKVGQSADLRAQNPQTTYILNPKMGTTRADVEFQE